MNYSPETLLSHLGNHPENNEGIINPPVYHASTVAFPSMTSFEEARNSRLDGFVSYGRFGTPTTFALEEAISRLEGNGRTTILPSGLAAISVTLGALLQSGDHLLMVDSVYGPARHFCDVVLPRFGVETTYYEPRDLPELAQLIQPRTKVIYTESPGSQTFELQDIPAIVSMAHANGSLVVMDNTWATPLYYSPLAHGVDVSIHAATKYIVGHSDVMLGVLTAPEELYRKIRNFAANFGYSVAPDDVYLGLRGLRTLSVRMKQHQLNALEVAKWLDKRPEVQRVLYPALPTHPDHKLWKRDFSGASGLFGVELKSFPDVFVRAMLSELKLFSIGASWGGYESLAVITYPYKSRSFPTWNAAGPTLRLHIGLEEPNDLINDLKHAFVKLSPGE